jgi:translation initiation factor IF-3
MVLDNGLISGPHVTRVVLERLDSSESLRMVNPYVPAKPKENRIAEFALCKIVNKKEEYLRQREVKERKRVAKSTTVKNKELELNWAIGDNDLQTKMRQLTGFFEKGSRVEIAMGRKKGRRKVEEAEAQEVLAKVKKGIEEAGGREYKAMDGQVSRTLRLYYEGGKPTPK